MVHGHPDKKIRTSDREVGGRSQRLPSLSIRPQLYLKTRSRYKMDFEKCRTSALRAGDLVVDTQWGQCFNHETVATVLRSKRQHLQNRLQPSPRLYRNRLYPIDFIGRGGQI